MEEVADLRVVAVLGYRHGRTSRRRAAPPACHPKRPDGRSRSLGGDPRVEIPTTSRSPCQSKHIANCSSGSRSQASPMPVENTTNGGHAGPALVTTTFTPTWPCPATPQRLWLGQRPHSARIVIGICAAGYPVAFSLPFDDVVPVVVAGELPLLARLSKSNVCRRLSAATSWFAFRWLSARRPRRVTGVSRCRVLMTRFLLYANHGCPRRPDSPGAHC